MADEYSLKAGQGNNVTRVFAQGFQPWFAISMKFDRKRSAAFFSLQHNGLSEHIMLRDCSFRLHRGVYISPMIYVEKTYTYPQN